MPLLHEQRVAAQRRDHRRAHGLSPCGLGDADELDRRLRPAAAARPAPALPREPTRAAALARRAARTRTDCASRESAQARSRAGREAARLRLHSSASAAVPDVSTALRRLFGERAAAGLQALPRRPARPAATSAADVSRRLFAVMMGRSSCEGWYDSPPPSEPSRPAPALTTASAKTRAADGSFSRITAEPFRRLSCGKICRAPCFVPRAQF